MAIVSPYVHGSTACHAPVPSALRKTVLATPLMTQRVIWDGPWTMGGSRCHGWSVGHRAANGRNSKLMSIVVVDALVTMQSVERRPGACCAPRSDARDSRRRRARSRGLQRDRRDVVGRRRRQAQVPAAAASDTARARSISDVAHRSNCFNRVVRTCWRYAVAHNPVATRNGASLWVLRWDDVVQRCIKVHFSSPGPTQPDPSSACAGEVSTGYGHTATAMEETAAAEILNYGT